MPTTPPRTHQSSRSPLAGKSKTVRCRNARSGIPDDIDLDVYKFLYKGGDRIESFEDLARHQNFKRWYSVQEDPRSAREKIRNRYKYLRRLRAENFENFVEGYKASVADAEAPPPKERATPEERAAEDAALTSNPTGGGGSDAAAAVAAASNRASNASSSSSSSAATSTTADATDSSTMSLRNSFNTFDFDRPENNPKGWWLVRNSAFMRDGMTIDKMEAYYPITDVRDAIHTDLSIFTDGNMILHEPRVTAFLRTNINDVHEGGDPLIAQAHSEPVTRMHASGQTYRTTKFFIPEGLSIRTAPFSLHPTQIAKQFVEGHLDFGEVGNDDLPILHEGQWLKFTFAINRATDINNNVRSADISQLASRFGDLGM